MSLPKRIDELDTASQASVSLSAGAAVAVVTGGKTIQTTMDQFGALGSFLQSGTGAVARTFQDKDRDIVSVKDFGAKGDGVTDDTAAIQAAIDYAKVNGRRLLIPFGAFNYTSLNLDGIIQGLSFLGEVDPSGATDFTKCSTLRCTSSGSGIGISIKSSYGVTFDRIALTYNNAGYTGDLVRTGHSGLATDTAFTGFNRCVFTGEGGAVGSASLFFTDQTINNTIKECTFKNAVVGIKTGTSYTNVMTVEKCMFQILTGHNILVDGTTTCQGFSFLGNTFEALANGKASGIDTSNLTNFIQGITISGGNWFGDVSVNGGVSWVHVKALGVFIGGNYFATAGSGAADYAIQIDACQGVEIIGNRFDNTALNIPTTCLGIEFRGNDCPLGETAIQNASGSSINKGGNNGIADVFGSVQSFTGSASPGFNFNPTSGATIKAAISQNANVLFFGQSGTANRVSWDIATGKWWFATDGGATQTAAGMFAGTGAPNNANGANGDIYFRSDGGALTTIYQRRAGTWTGII